MTPTTPAPPLRRLSPAECYTPDLLQSFLLRLEAAEQSRDVWRLIVDAGRSVALPFVDFVTAAGPDDGHPALTLRTSYDTAWLAQEHGAHESPAWSIFHRHARDRLTPLLVGLEFSDEAGAAPHRAMLEAAAARGMRAGVSIPLRQHAPPRAALLTFWGNHSRRDMGAIVRAHGWALHAVALVGHQRYMHLVSREFVERNQITDKQCALPELIGLGLQDKEIAERLDVSVSAVRQRMSALSARTGLSSRAEFAILAMTLGLLPDPTTRAGHTEAMRPQSGKSVGERAAPQHPS